MVYETGVVFGAVMLATGLLSAWISLPTTPAGGFDTDPSARTTLALAGAVVVAVIGAAIVVLSALE